jgi:hypothetical protein
VERNVYYTTLDNWYLTKYIDIESNSIDMIISNIQNLLMEVQNWKHENLKVTVREESIQTPYGLVFFTYDKEVAERIFTKGYRIIEKESFLENSSIDLANDEWLKDKSSSLLSNESEQCDDSLSDALIETDKDVVDNNQLQVEVEEHLPDELFDDLEEIGLSTVENDANPEDAEDTLPEDLFHDLAERTKSTVEAKARREEE